MGIGKAPLKIGVLGLLVVVGFLAAAAMSSGNDGWWGADQGEVEALVVKELHADKATCRRTKSGDNVQRWHCDVIRPTGTSIVRIYRSGAVSASGRQGLPGFVIVPSK